MGTTPPALTLESALQNAGSDHFRYWVSVIGSAAADGTAFMIAYFLFRMDRPVPSLALVVGRPAHSLQPIDALLLLAVAFIAVRYLSGDYSRRQLFWDGAKFTTMALIVASMPDLFMLFLGGPMYAKIPVFLSWISLLIFIPLLRQAARIAMTAAGVWQIPTAIVGLGNRTTEIAAALNGSLSLGFDLRWLVIENSQDKAPPQLQGLTTVYAPDAASAARAVWQAGCKQAIVAADDIQSSHFSNVIQRLMELNVRVAIIPSLNRLPLAHVTTNYFFGRGILMLQVRSNVQRLPWRIVKRIFDIVVSAAALALLLPLFALFVIAIKLDSAGPATYFQMRVGRRGVQFPCYKFRTMVTNADEILDRWKIDNPTLYAEFLETFKLRDDPRVTRIGRWLRKTSMDELPQLWNVLRGDMSLVGPRPIPEQQLRDQYGTAAQLYMRVRPGISGLWQVSGRSETTADQRVILDEWYILNWSFWYDIVILVQTAWIVVSGKGAY